ncbi:MAG: NUDIX hydrolase [Gammaproteobacteria bacterium]
MRNSIPLYRGRVIRFEIEHAALPDGSDLRMECVRHPGGVTAVVLDADGEKVAFVRQYRPALRRWIWELPAGKREPGEEADDTIRREIIEEIGAHCTDWHHLGGVWATPGFCDERIELYSCRVDSLQNTAHEAGEVMEVHWLSIAEVDDMLLSGEIEDAKTLSALLHWKMRR